MAIPLATGIREALAEGYHRPELLRDLLAGVVVGVVALPLSMALAIASGVGPEHGLYTAAFAGAVAAVAGGSRVAVTGPTAAFVVLLAPIAAQHGAGGLMLASFMAGVVLLGMGLARLGRLVQFVPSPVVSGFTAGIAVVIGTLQIKDALGLSTGELPSEFLDKLAVIVAALPTARWQDGLIAALTLAVLLLWPRIERRVPSPLVALSVAAVVAALVPGLDVATVADRFGEIPRGLPAPGLPWEVTPTWAQVRELMPSAFAIAMLGAIESLLCAVAADGMTGRRHDPDAELVGQGLANLVGPLFGGIAATGAIARTATNVRSAAYSPVASVVHSAVVLLALVALAPLLGYLPMSALAGLLLLVAWNMSDARHVARVARTAPRSDVVVLVTCLVLTVVFDMVVSVGVGVVLASLLFMRRMAEVSGVRMVGEAGQGTAQSLPPGVLVYAIAGPLFFGAAEKAAGALGQVAAGTRAMVLDLSAVPVIDATGLVNLESAVGRLQRGGTRVVLAGLQPQPERALRKAGWFGGEGPSVEVRAGLDDAISTAAELIER